MSEQWFAAKNKESGLIEFVSHDEFCVKEYNSVDDLYDCIVVPVRIVEDGEPCEWEKFNTFTNCDGSVNICPPGMGIIDSFVINFCPMCGRSLEGK